MSERKVPEVRFQGFSGEWETLKLSDVADIVGGGTPSTQIPEYWNGEIAWYSPTEIGKSVYADHSQKTITELGFEKCSTKMLPANTTVLFTSRAGIGDMAILRHAATTNQGFQSFVLKDGYDTYFLYSSGCYIKSYALKNASGSTFLEISGKQLEKMDYTLPDEKEQIQIGDFFKNLDDLIAQNQKKYDKLVNMKKACLDKMFPKDGADTPEVRFQGFSGEWGQYNWRDTVDVSTSMVDPRTGEFDELPHIGPGNIEAFSGNLMNNVKSVRADCLISGKFHFYEDDIIYGKINPQLAKYVIAPYEGLSSADTYILNAKNGLEQLFLFSILHTKNFFKYTVSVSMRSGMPKINRDELSVYNFSAPLFDEQVRIGTFFQTLDKLITLRKTELEKLKNIKKACLDKMFI